MTHRYLYMLDSYQKEFSSKVVALLDPNRVVLENTVFYPQGGGQPFDIGVLEKNNALFGVVSVRKQDGMIVHEVDRAGLQVEDVVTGKIDWDRRYRLMRMHTAAHVICAVFEKNENTKITGNQLDLERSRVDISMENFDREKIQKYIDEANSILARNLPIEVKFIRMEDAKKDSSLFKLAMEFPHQLDEIRLVDIVGHDLQADGGTHVRNTAEVGKIILLDCQNKGKDKRRFYFGLE